MPDVPSLLGSLAKNEGVLHAVYSDLAAPGVKQVGAALETVLKTGNILLLPFRMLNEYAAQFERRSFAEIADRLKEIPQEDIIDVRPEIGAPILERLSSTHDPDLRKLFIELLASAADKRGALYAHPSFVRVIESLSPDEALLLKEWNGEGYIPFLSLHKASKDEGYSVIKDIVTHSSITQIDRSMISVYVANMSGLGLMTPRTDAWLTTEDFYRPIIDDIRADFPNAKEGRLTFKGMRSDIKEGDIFFEKGYIEMLSYGRVFQKACLEG